jgi:putative ABC transport system permease protein
MQTLLQDIRYALRQLRKSPGFTLVAVLTLALGIGANTAIYSIIHGSLRLPYPNSERMVAIENVYPEAKYFSTSFPDFQQWRAQSKTFSYIVVASQSNMTWSGSLTGSASGSSSPQNLNVDLVSRGYFRMYGLQPIAGRTFLPAEHEKGGAPVCVLSEKFWREQLGSDPAILGKTMNLNGEAFTVVGISPELVNSIQRADLWVPLEPRAPWVDHDTNYLFNAGLLRRGVTMGEADAELRGIQAQINKQFPDNKHDVDLQPLSKAVFGNLHTLMLMLQAAVGFILLIACVNLANMLLARAANRAREFAVRRALGASPTRMIRQALTESLLLSLTGAAAGLLFAEALIHIPITAWPKNFVPPSQVHLDGMVLAFTAILAVGTGIVFGLVPALRILRQDEKDTLQLGRTVTDSREQNRTRSVLVIAEIALSMLLVAGALNMAFYFLRLLHTDPGMNPKSTLSMTLSLSPKQYANPDAQRRFLQTALDKLSALSGVSHVAVSSAVPFTAKGSNGSFSYDNQPESTEDHNPFADLRWVTPGYFAAVETPLLQGRAFTRDDGPDAQKVAIINRTMARTLWPGQSAIGKNIHCCAKGASFAVIGVVADVHADGPASPANFTIYISADQFPLARMCVLLRTHGDPMALADPARAAIASIDPGQAVADVISLQDLEQQSIAGQRTSTLVTAILGCLALLLASIGVYGVMAYSVSRREREFGIRMALGANRGAILKMLFAGMLRFTVIGVLLGAALAFALREWIESVLGANGATAASATYALLLGALLLCAVAALATLLPARHAMHVEPMHALRTE